MQVHPNIVTVPHQSLRQVAKPVVDFDKKTKQVIKELVTTLEESSDRGVGLAAPQIDTKWRIYVTKSEFASGKSEFALRKDGSAKNKKQTEKKRNTPYAAVFINPEITRVSKKIELGEDGDGTPLEGCLSIPGIFGPIPRHQWIELWYQTPNDSNTELITKEVRLHDFSARLAQHEIDHLNGVLFTDYTLEYDLPLYAENDQGELEKLIDTRFVEGF
jgi:peptide deformylase